MTDQTIIHYDIRAVTGVTRAACGIDNRISEFVSFQASNNRNVATCRDCRDKIDLLAEFGGDAIMAPQDHDNRRWFIDAVKEAIAEEEDENDEEYVDWHQRQLALALKKHDDQYFLSQRKQIMEAVADTMHAGKFKLDPEELRGQMHRVLNGRIEQDIRLALEHHEQSNRRGDVIELTRIINSVFNNKLAEAGYLVAQDFMESEKVKNRLIQTSMAGAELNFEETKDELVELVKETLEEILRENPVQFVQNIVQPESLSASEVYRQTRGLLEHSSAHAPLPVNFAEFNHQALGVWASANDLVREWSYDTNMVRRLLEMRQRDGKLVRPGEDD